MTVKHPWLLFHEGNLCEVPLGARVLNPGYFWIKPAGYRVHGRPKPHRSETPIVSPAEQQPVAELSNKHSEFAGFGFCCVLMLRNILLLGSVANIEGLQGRWFCRSPAIYTTQAEYIRATRRSFLRLSLSLFRCVLGTCSMPHRNLAWSHQAICLASFSS